VPSKTSTSTTEIDVEDIEYIEKEEKIEEVSLEAVEFVPIYPGCENLETNLARKNCFQENLKELITRNFDSQRMQPYAVSGINRISVQFTVDETGHITNIKTRAANPQLEKEAQRVINKIPTMQPGVKNGKKVKVFYGQPILFKLDN
ncbi:MAG: energy transducer TonB, partial [Leeuwenhoekiella sp.]